MTCLLCSQIFLKEDDQLSLECERASPQGETKSGFHVGPAMAVLFSITMEQNSNDVIRQTRALLLQDASGSWGCGAFTSEGEWFQLKLPHDWSTVHITTKELLPIVLGAALWGKKWARKHVRCRCDNAATVAILNTGRSRDDKAMHLMRCLFFLVARFDIVLIPEV